MFTTSFNLFPPQYVSKTHKQVQQVLIFFPSWVSNTQLNHWTKWVLTKFFFFLLFFGCQIPKLINSSSLRLSISHPLCLCLFLIFAPKLSHCLFVTDALEGENM